MKKEMVVNHIVSFVGEVARPIKGNLILESVAESLRGERVEEREVTNLCYIRIKSNLRTTGSW
jgi:hypothetical protein